MGSVKAGREIHVVTIKLIVSESAMEYDFAISQTSHVNSIIARKLLWE
jgi:hypothetical protein